MSSTPRASKIDQTFVRQLVTDVNDQIIVRSIVDLSDQLGYRVTAEGVEDQGALEYLKSVGCDHAQGYFISRTLPAADMSRLMADRG